MELIDLLQQAQGGNALGAIGEQFGLDKTQTAAAVQELAPVIAAGLRRNMSQSPENVVSLVQALQNGNHSQYLDDPNTLQFGNVSGDGNAILGHIFGSKDVSREVALRAAGSSGIGSSIMKKLLPVIASMVIGSLTKKMTGGATAPSSRGGSGGGLGDILGQVLGGGSGRSGGGGLGDILGQVLGGGSQRKQPAPQPRQQPQGGGLGGGLSGGLGDLLNDMLGGGATTNKRNSRPTYNEDVIGKSRNGLDDFLGGGSSRGNAADDLLGSVEKYLNRR